MHIILGNIYILFNSYYIDSQLKKLSHIMVFLLATQQFYVSKFLIYEKTNNLLFYILS